MWGLLPTYVTRKLNSVTSLVPPPPGESGAQRKVLVIQCHPLPDSFSASIGEAVKRGLHTAGHEIRYKKLYFSVGNVDEYYNGATFPPALTTEERVEYHNPKNVQERTDNITPLQKLPTMAVEVRQAIDDLKWCDSVVFVYPTWWFNFPAVLKGYFDRVLLPGVAFFLPNSDSKSGPTTGSTGLIAGLTNITKIGAVTTSGASALTTFYAGNAARSFISTALRALCAPECPLLWHQLYEISSTTEIQRKQFLLEVEKAYGSF